MLTFFRLGDGEPLPNLGVLIFCWWITVGLSACDFSLRSKEPLPTPVFLELRDRESLPFLVMLLLRREVTSILPLCDVPGLSSGELWTMLVSFLLGEGELSPFLGVLLL